ncbi:MAG: phosphoenolpyruvate carboxylase [Flavobacteriaceae bacterium]
MARKLQIERFDEVVRSKYQVYNSLFLTLPFKTIKDTSLMLPLFADACVKGFEQRQAPDQIVADFFQNYLPELDEAAQKDVLFAFIKYIERQVVLFDAIEDAGFSYVNNMHGRGTLRFIKEEAQNNSKLEALKEYLERFKVRIVLTAHPTQFYPNTVLTIIRNLAKAIRENELDEIKQLLDQLGLTRFYNKKKPTPLDEANSLIWYLENVFYHSAGAIASYLRKNIFENETIDNTVFDFGFWPGGDRDGNPYVTPEITLKTAETLRHHILRNYYRELRFLKTRLTFDGVLQKVEALETALYHTLFFPKKTPISLDELTEGLEHIANDLKVDHNGFYLDLVLDLIDKVKLFGYHFASLDIRQDSRVHEGVFLEVINHPKVRATIGALKEHSYQELSLEQRLELLTRVEGSVDPALFDANEITAQTLESISVMREIQQRNGERGSNRYIISNCQSLEHLLQLYALIRLCGWSNPSVDIIPLFETVDDLRAAPDIMRELYSNASYRAHLESRGMKQTVMLGFSDGTKDGGYFMANWGIYSAKEALSLLSTEFGVSVAFFDGRGGPPARGGGRTHEFYASLGEQIQADDIQLTVQGQTISSNFGTLESSQYNLEQLLSSGIKNQLFARGENNLSTEDRETLETLAQVSYDAYVAFKNHELFLPYLQEMTTLPYYAKTNIGSRPAKRGQKKEFKFEDLRAIPFVGSWSQLRQNVPGFYGVGYALESFKKSGDFDRVKRLYQNNAFFRTLIANSMMSLTKSQFELTSYMAKNERFGEFWSQIHQEYKRSKELVLELSGFSTLLENERANKASIQLREGIVHPLLTIQQYALQRVAKTKDPVRREWYEKMVTRSMFGNINASRNSA